MAMNKFALCLSNDFGPDFDGGDVLPGLTYECLGEERGMLRVVDESGEDYLYPDKFFMRIELSQPIESAIRRAAG